MHTVSMPSAAVKIESLTKAFGNHEVLHDISFDVQPGEVLAIIGPSGSGKSTLLRCINFLERSNSGFITIDDTRYDVRKKYDNRVYQKIRRKVGMVFQSFNLFPHLSVIRNVALAQERTLGIARAEAEEASLALLERVGLADKAYLLPSQCSGGQQQRVAIARALALKPDVILFDEPTSALDPELGLEVLGVMRELADSGMTMIVVTHEMKFAENVSNRVIFMVDGAVVETGPSHEVMRNPQHSRTRSFLHAVNNR